MNIELVKKGTLLVSNETSCPILNRSAAGVQVLEVTDKGFKLKRMHLSHNGETFFTTKENLQQSNWMIAPDYTQMAFL